MTLPAACLSQWSTRLAFDCLAEELSTTMDFQEQFRTAAQRNILPPTYEDHPLVRESPKSDWPFPRCCRLQQPRRSSPVLDYKLGQTPSRASAVVVSVSIGVVHTQFLLAENGSCMRLCKVCTLANDTTATRGAWMTQALQCLGFKAAVFRISGDWAEFALTRLPTRASQSSVLRMSHCLFNAGRLGLVAQNFRGLPGSDGYGQDTLTDMQAIDTVCFTGIIGPASSKISSGAPVGQRDGTWKVACGGE